MPIEIGPKWIRKSKLVTESYYCRRFDKDDPRSGLSFDCDPEGNVDESQLNNAALINWTLCSKAGSVDGKSVVDKGVVVSHNTYIEPGIIQCFCERQVYLVISVNPCSCGAFYSIDGTLISE